MHGKEVIAFCPVLLHIEDMTGNSMLVFSIKIYIEEFASESSAASLVDCRYTETRL